jgi:hypothetical protein
MSHFVEILDHPKLTEEGRKLIGMKGRIIAKAMLDDRKRIYLTDGREVLVPDVALRPIPKKDF